MPLPATDTALPSGQGDSARSTLLQDWPRPASPAREIRLNSASNDAKASPNSYRCERPSSRLGPPLLRNQEHELSRLLDDRRPGTAPAIMTQRRAEAIPNEAHYDEEEVAVRLAAIPRRVSLLAQRSQTIGFDVRGRPNSLPPHAAAMGASNATSAVLPVAVIAKLIPAIYLSLSDTVGSLRASRAQAIAMASRPQATGGLPRKEGILQLDEKAGSMNVTVTLPKEASVRFTDDNTSTGSGPGPQADLSVGGAPTVVSTAPERFFRGFDEMVLACLHRGGPGTSDLSDDAHENEVDDSDDLSVGTALTAGMQLTQLTQWSVPLHHRPVALRVNEKAGRKTLIQQQDTFVYSKAHRHSNAVKIPGEAPVDWSFISVDHFFSSVFHHLCAKAARPADSDDAGLREPPAHRIAMLEAFALFAGLPSPTSSPQPGAEWRQGLAGASFRPFLFQTYFLPFAHAVRGRRTVEQLVSDGASVFIKLDRLGSLVAGSLGTAEVPARLSLGLRLDLQRLVLIRGRCSFEDLVLLLLPLWAAADDHRRSVALSPAAPLGEEATTELTRLADTLVSLGGAAARDGSLPQPVSPLLPRGDGDEPSPGARALRRDGANAGGPVGLFHSRRGRLAAEALATETAPAREINALGNYAARPVPHDERLTRPATAPGAVRPGGPVSGGRRRQKVAFARAFQGAGHRSPSPPARHCLPGTTTAVKGEHAAVEAAVSSPSSSPSSPPPSLPPTTAALLPGAVDKSIRAALAAASGLLKRDADRSGSASCEDLQDPAVAALLRLVEGLPPLFLARLDRRLRDALRPDAEWKALCAARREMIRADAAVRRASVAALPTRAARQEAEEEGALDLCGPAVLAAREAMFEDDVGVNQLLDDWWDAAQTYIDGDKDDTLGAAEYAVFQRQLLKIASAASQGMGGGGGGEGRLVGDVDGDGVLSEAEQVELLGSSFAAASGGDGSVSREELRCAVFLLADRWVPAVASAKGYASFLGAAHAVVFGDLARGDAPRFPPAWARSLGRAKVLSPLPEDRTVFALAGLVLAKAQIARAAAVEARDVASGEESGGAPGSRLSEAAREPLSAFVLRHFASFSSSPTSSSSFSFSFSSSSSSPSPGKAKGLARLGAVERRAFKAFALGVAKLLGRAESAAHEAAFLFAAMVGICTPSGR